MRQEEVVKKVLDLRYELMNDGKFGPYIVRVPRNINLGELYVVGKSSIFTLKDRILQIDNIEKVVSHSGPNIEVTCNE